MSLWKKIFLGIRNDVPLVKKELIVFSAVYAAVNALKQERTNELQYRY
jgi:hypothetical protein